MNKKCTKCKKLFPKTLEYFSLDKRNKDGFVSWCRDCFKIYNKEYRVKLLLTLKENNRKFDNSPKRAYLRLKQSSRKLLVTISLENFLKWYDHQPKICHYCGIEETKLPIDSDSFNCRTTRLSIDRMDSKKGYEEGNMVLCCLRCNSLKSDFFTPSEMREIGQKYVSKRWEKC